MKFVLAGIFVWTCESCGISSEAPWHEMLSRKSNTIDLGGEANQKTGSAPSTIFNLPLNQNPVPPKSPPKHLGSGERPITNGGKRKFPFALLQTRKVKGYFSFFHSWRGAGPHPKLHGNYLQQPTYSFANYDWKFRILSACETGYTIDLVHW